jgi:DNA-binding transcriptional ArsR family regulator
MIDVHVTTSQLGDLLGTLAHPHRLLLVMALAKGPRDANQLTKEIGISQLGVVEHLRVLRAHHVVKNSQDGSRPTYELTWPGIVDWLSMSLAFIEGHLVPIQGRMVELPRAGAPASPTS